MNESELLEYVKSSIFTNGYYCEDKYVDMTCSFVDTKKTTCKLFNDKNLKAWPIERCSLCIKTVG